VENNTAKDMGNKMKNMIINLKYRICSLLMNFSLIQLVITGQ